MRIRENKLYELYLAYLENKKISAGQMRLAQISESLFEDFVMRLDNDPHFRTELSSIYLDLRRKDLISEILDVDSLLKKD
jgi:hypothetical protein